MCFSIFWFLADLPRNSLITQEKRTYLNIQTDYESSWIHPFRSHLCSGSQGGSAGVYPSSLQAKEGLHPGQVASSLQGHIERQTTLRTHTPTANLVFLNLPHVPVFGLREGAAASGENPRRHSQNMETLHWAKTQNPKGPFKSTYRTFAADLQWIWK